MIDRLKEKFPKTTRRVTDILKVTGIIITTSQLAGCLLDTTGALDGPSIISSSQDAGKDTNNTLPDAEKFQDVTKDTQNDINEDALDAGIDVKQDVTNDTKEDAIQDVTIDINESGVDASQDVAKDVMQDAPQDVDPACEKTTTLIYRYNTGTMQLIKKLCALYDNKCYTTPTTILSKLDNYKEDFNIVVSSASTLEITPWTLGKTLKVEQGCATSSCLTDQEAQQQMQSVTQVGTYPDGSHGQTINHTTDCSSGFYLWKITYTQ